MIDGFKGEIVLKRNRSWEPGFVFYNFLCLFILFLCRFSNFREKLRSCVLSRWFAQAIFWLTLVEVLITTFRLLIELDIIHGFTICKSKPTVCILQVLAPSHSSSVTAARNASSIANAYEALHICSICILAAFSFEVYL